MKPWTPVQPQQRSKGNFCKLRNDIPCFRPSGFLVEVIQTLAVKCPYAGGVTSYIKETCRPCMRANVMILLPVYLYALYIMLM